ncbi:MAG: exodeoxyribonuclease I [Methyloglobulus sp.]|nr:exodeoxyribonuclease I [Pseudomonadota bacterium]MSS76156.1 exodeoxyribonuclease I [Methyloglobulus sp.]
MTETSLYWHDYETFGIDPRRDRPSQFAGVRTDVDLNIIDDPFVVYCKPPADYLPHPEACFLTGISPQLAEYKGVIEAEFCRLIHEQIAQPNTCSLGYNSIRFDDEFTRNCLYRNFYDPYAREWQNGNSRWDLIDVVRATKALRPDGINWPTDAEGRQCFKLEELTKANGIAHEAAHDALSDVYATIALAKLIKSAQPKLYQFLWQHRTKTEVLKLLQFGSFKPVVHVSGMYSSDNQRLAVVLPVCKHPSNTNGILVYDLSIDPEPLISLSIEDIQQRIFTATADLSEGVERVPLKTVHINKYPVLAPISVLKLDDQQRLHLDLARCYANIDKIKAAPGMAEKIAAVFSESKFAESSEEIDPDLAIYSGGFFSDADKQKMQKIRNTPSDQLATFKPNFTDPRLGELLFRYRARNYPELLQPEEITKWGEFCANRITGHQPGGSITLDEYFSQLALMRNKTANAEAFSKILTAFGLEKAQQLGLKI